MSLNSLNEIKTFDSFSKKIKMYPPSFSTKDWILEILGSNEHEKAAITLEKQIGTNVYYLLQVNDQDYKDLKIPEDVVCKIKSSLGSIIQCCDLEFNDLYSLFYPVCINDSNESK